MTTHSKQQRNETNRDDHHLGCLPFNLGGYQVIQQEAERPEGQLWAFPSSILLSHFHSRSLAYLPSPLHVCPQAPGCHQGNSERVEPLASGKPPLCLAPPEQTRSRSEQGSCGR